MDENGTFRPSGTRLVLVGEGVQTIDFQTTSSSPYDIVDEEGSGAAFPSRLCLAKMRSDLTVVGDATADTNVDLNGHELTVTGDLTHRSGVITLTSVSREGGATDAGRLSVRGSYVSDGGDGWGGKLAFSSDAVMDVGGDMVLKDAYSGALGAKNHTMTGGEIRLAGSLVDENGTFRPSGTRLVLVGEGVQTIDFQTTSSKFAGIETNGKPIRFIKFLGLSKLPVDITIAGNFELMQDLNLNAHSLVIEHSLVHSNGKLSISSGTLIVNGDYRLQSKSLINDSVSYGACAAQLSMLNAQDNVLVRGGFIFQSTVSHNSTYLKDGNLTICGDFTDLSSSCFRPAGNHMVTLDGTEIQRVSFPNTTDKFNKLKLTQTRNRYVFSPDKCWNELAVNMVDGIELSATTMELAAAGETAQLTAVVTPDDAYDKTLSWSSSDESVATVTQNGVVTAVSSGTATITAVPAYGDVSASCSVMVDIPVPTTHVSGVTLDKETLTFASAGETGQLSATVLPDDADDRSVSWSSTDEHVATVSQDGVVTAVANGSASIVATTTDGGFSATCEVTVAIPAPVVHVTGVAIDVAEATLVSEGEGLQLTATVEPDDASDPSVVWSTSDETVATVSQDGYVIAVANGTAGITATTTDGNLSATCLVRVDIPAPTIPVISVALDHNELLLTAIGESVQVTAVINPKSATDQRVAWHSSDESVVTVSEAGVVVAVADGDTTVTATTVDGGFSASCHVVVEIPQAQVAVEGVTLSSSLIELASEGAQETLIATVSPADSTDKSVSWESSDVSVATVDDAGTVTAVSNGTATVTVTTLDGGFTATCEVSVAIPAPTVHVTGVSVEPGQVTLSSIGETAQLSVEVSPGDASDTSVAWTSTNDSVISVDSSGTITAVSPGSASVIAITNDGGYASACLVTVAIPAAPSLVDAIVTIEAEGIVYDGSEKKPEVIVIYGDSRLVKGTDYTLSYSDNVNPGTATVTVTGMGGYTGRATATFEIAGQAESASVPIYRLYNKLTSEHLYTMSKGEYDQLPVITGGDWAQEGVAWYAPAKGAAGASPVWRLYNEGLGDHHYTASAGERDALVASAGWKVENVAFYTAAKGDNTIGLYRLYNGGLMKGQHHYTASAGERDALVANAGWKAEGVAFYGLR